MTEPTLAPKPCIIMIGSIEEGFTPVGPFISGAAARAWADVHCAGNEEAGERVNVMPLTPPEAAQQSM